MPNKNKADNLINPEFFKTLRMSLIYSLLLLDSISFINYEIVLLFFIFVCFYTLSIHKIILFVIGNNNSKTYWWRYSEWK